ncbi:protein ABHD12B isoform X2 [Ambystoma mexicanum]|uniref:protein ABHD12B isoform X2 n=1 Tax=Ambystoma mexicanum TaxID=8296 RepID=UPI0037E89C5E
MTVHCSVFHSELAKRQQREAGDTMKRRDVHGGPQQQRRQERDASGSRAAKAAAPGPSEPSGSRSLLTPVKRLTMILVVVYVAIPFILRLFPVLLAKVIYLNMLKAPFFVDLQQPGLLLNHTTNFYLAPEDGIIVGIWHTVPERREEEARGQSQEWFSASLSDNSPAIIYLHGNAGTRAAGHRIQLMKVLSGAGFHVLALDYRGYGESTGDPSEEGLTTDAVHLYEWVKERKRKGPVCFWGHSLGSGVATNAAKLLEEKGTPVDAVILEAPFTNIRDAVASNPFAKLYRVFPGFEYFFLDVPALNNIFFPNDKNVKMLSSPLLILHAEDDHIVPVEMGTKLYEIADASRNSSDRTKLVLFPGGMGYKHNRIHMDPTLPGIAWEFVKTIKMKGSTP